MAKDTTQSGGARHPFPAKLSKQVQSQFTEFENTDMSGFTFERHHSDFRDARADLHVYNENGKLVLHGRDFGNRTFFWTP